MLTPAPLPSFYTKKENLPLKSISFSWDTSSLVERDLVCKLETFTGLNTPEFLQKACLKRQFEFLAGRYCAQEALKSAGYTEKYELLAGPAKDPLWPPLFVGSITHSYGFAAATVASTSGYEGIGIDSEPLASLAKLRALVKRVAGPREKEQFVFAGLNEQEYFTLVFSAKESIYKCLFPLVKKLFFYHDAEITRFCLDTKTFQFRLLTKLDFRFMDGFEGKGYFEVVDGRVHTAVFLDHV